MITTETMFFNNHLYTFPDITFLHFLRSQVRLHFNHLPLFYPRGGHTLLSSHHHSACAFLSVYRLRKLCLPCCLVLTQTNYDRVMPTGYPLSFPMDQCCTLTLSRSSPFRSMLLYVTLPVHTHIIHSSLHMHYNAITTHGT